MRNKIAYVDRAYSREPFENLLTIILLILRQRLSMHSLDGISSLISKTWFKPGQGKGHALETLNARVTLQDFIHSVKSLFVICPH